MILGLGIPQIVKAGPLLIAPNVSVLGLGHVGPPLAARLARRFDGIGQDGDRRRRHTVRTDLDQTRQGGWDERPCRHLADAAEARRGGLPESAFKAIAVAVRHDEWHPAGVAACRSRGVPGGAPYHLKGSFPVGDSDARR